MVGVGYGYAYLSLSGAEIDMMNDRSLVECVSNLTVLARTTPRHKMHIVKAFLSRGAGCDR